MNRIRRICGCLCAFAALLLLPAVAMARVQEDGRIARDGFDLYYHSIGHGEPLVLLSGGPGSNVDILLPVAEELGRDYRCVLLEQRGTGRSRLKAITAGTVSLGQYVDDLEAVREHLKLSKLTLLGNSWGMLLALAYGAAHPERVRAIVTMGSGPISHEYFSVFTDNVHSRLRPMELAAENRAASLTDHDVAEYETVRAILPAYFYDYDRGLRYAKALKPGALNGDINHVVMGALLHERLDLRPNLRRISAPVLLLQGRQDPAGEANLYEAHLALSGSRIEFIEKCGHLPWVEQPDRFTGYAANFWTISIVDHPAPAQWMTPGRCDRGSVRWHSERPGDSEGRFSARS